MRGMRGESTIRTAIGISILTLPIIALMIGIVSVRQFTASAAPLPANELLITASDSDQTANVGDTIQYTYVLSNSTAAAKAVDITVATAPDDWQTRLVDTAQASLIVAAGAEATVVVEVRIPTYENGVDDGDTAVTTVSVADGADTLTASNTTTAATTKGFDIVLPSAQTAGPSTTATFRIEATNSGSTQQDLALEIISEGNYPTDILALDDGSTLVSQVSKSAVAPSNNPQVFEIVMQIPSTASGGDTNTAQAKITYGGREEIFDVVVTIDQALIPTDTPTTVPTTAPTDTPAPEPVATSDGSIYADDREPNNSRAQAAFFDGGLTEICNQTFWPTSDIDHYAFIATAGMQYTISSKETSAGSGTGLDPVMKIINPQGNVVADNDTYTTDTTISIFPTVIFVPSQSGTFIIEMTNKGVVDPTNLTYCIDVEQAVYQSPTPTTTTTPTPTTTPTQTPTPTATPDGDSCEPNETLDTACLIALNTNNGQDFVPGYGVGIDRDYFRIWVKPNVLHNCRVTINDGSIADTTITIFDQSGGWLGFNDDRAPDDNGSQVFFSPTYQGYAYILVEPLNAPVDLQRSDTIENLYAYTLRCESAPPTSTPLPTSTHTPTHTPTKTPTPVPTSTPEPSSTPQPTSTSTPITPSALTDDDCEPNENTGQSCLLAPGEAVGANFRPPYGSGNDRDYFRTYVKPGIEYTCETRNLSPLSDTKLTVFNLNGQQIGFNDDRETGDFSSEVTVNPGYQGEIFILVESSRYIRPEDADQFSYQVLCQSSVIPTLVPTETFTPWPTNTPWPTRTPWPSPTPTTEGAAIPKATNTSVPGNNSTAAPTARPSNSDDDDNGNGNDDDDVVNTAVPTNIPLPTSTPRPRSTPQPTPTLRPTSTPQPTPTLAPTATPQPTATPFIFPTDTPVPSINIVPIATATPVLLPTPNVQLSVKVYYDGNNSFSAELNEGVMDIAVSVYDNASGALLGFGYTNEAGEVFFGGNPPLPTSGAVRLIIPYLNYEQIVPADVTQVDIRIPPQQLPGQIP